MAEVVVMPQMGYDMQQGTVVRWLKVEGDTVSKLEPIAEIETDKAVVELEAPVRGSMLRIMVAEGTSVPVGTPIAYIGEAGETVAETLSGRPAASASPIAASRQEMASPSPTPQVTAERRFASPLARRMAEERGVDLSQIRGTGPSGRITKEDVIGFANGAPAGAPPSPEVAASPSLTRLQTGTLAPRRPDADGFIGIGKMGQAIARRTQATFNQAPHFYVTVRVDMTDALAWREKLNETVAPEGRVSVNYLVMKACALALTKHPVFNSTYETELLRVHSLINIGIALALPEGLMVPAILECDRKTVTEIAVEAKDLAARAKAGKLRQEEYTGTFSVSNLGMFGVESFSAIVVSPQVAVLAVGEVQDAVVPRDGGIHVRKIMSATLSTDHRAANGAEAALFAAEIKRLLEDPEKLS